MLNSIQIVVCNLQCIIIRHLARTMETWGRNFIKEMSAKTRVRLFHLETSRLIHSETGSQDLRLGSLSAGFGLAVFWLFWRNFTGNSAPQRLVSYPPSSFFGTNHLNTSLSHHFPPPLLVCLSQKRKFLSLCKRMMTARPCTALTQAGWSNLLSDMFKD